MIKDTVTDIWDRSWRCRFSRNLTTPVDHLEKVGIYISGDGEYELDTPDEEIDTYITINDMVEMHRKGIRISIVDYKEVEEIYRIIETHILRWRKSIEESVNIGEAPLDDLIAMDAFATSIYDKAKYLMLDKAPAASALEYMRSLTGGVVPRLKSLSELEEEKRLKENPVELEKKIPERLSHESVFKGIAAGLRRWS
jgi:hypothetical protein